MSDERAKEQVTQLLATLHSSAPDDPELRGMLKELDGDIHAALANPALRDDPSADLGARASDLAARFKVKHPRLEPVLEELVNLIASIGI